MRFPNGYGSIINLGKNRRKPYAVRITIGWSDDKKQRYKYLGYFEKETQAFECLVEFNKNPYDIDVKKITLKEVYDKWSERHFEKISLNSKKSYISSFKKCEVLYDTPICQLKTKDFQKIVDNIESISTARTFKNVIKMIYSYAIKNDIVEKDYSDYIEFYQEKNQHNTSVFSNLEINLLWEHQGPDSVDVLLILLYSGMRINELLKIETKNIFFNERYMITGSKTKSGKDRVIPIHKKIAPLIEKRLNGKYLFETRNGTPVHYNNMLKLITTDFKRLGLNHVVHETRHTFISQADRLDINKITLKRIVGHSSKKDVTDDIYTHKNKEDLIKAIDLFDY